MIESSVLTVNTSIGFPNRVQSYNYFLTCASVLKEKFFLPNKINNADSNTTIYV